MTATPVSQPTSHVPHLPQPLPQPLSSPSTTTHPRSERAAVKPTPRVAVLVNRKAGAVNGRVLATLEQVAGARDLFVSTSLESAQGIARYLVAQRYDVIMCAGGDGTFSRAVTDVHAEVARLHGSERAFAKMPAFGMLRLGTGNGVANTLGASPRSAKGFAMDLWRARATAPGGKLWLLEVDGRLAPFAGYGLDAQILDDHGRVARAMASAGLGFLGTGHHSYAVSVSGLSIGRALLTRRPEVIVRNLGAPAVWQGAGPRAGKVVPPGEVIYRGPITLCSASTVPYYGLGMKMFPFVDGMQPVMQLRIFDGTPFEILSNLPAVWRGEYRSDATLRDLLATRVSIEVLEPEGQVLQVAGDLVGVRRRVEIGLAPHPVRAVL